MSKKGENIYKRKDGRWEGRYIRDRKPDGTAVYGYVYSKSYAEAKEKLTKAKTAPSNNAMNDCFEYYAKQWLETKKYTAKESTYARYHVILHKHILPFWGRLKLNDISQQYMNQFIESKQRVDACGCKEGGLSPKTVKDMVAVLKSILYYADCNIRIICPVDTAYPMNETAVLSKAEQMQLTAQLIKQPDNIGLGILVSLYTGIRIGELCALRFCDFDFDDGVLSINHTMQRIKDMECPLGTKIITTAPKTPKAVRTIPLPEFLCQKIKSACPDDKNSYFLSGCTEVFVEPRLMQYRFERILKANGIKKINFHALRHTFATRCIESGFEIKSLSEILGHSNVNITLNRYAHSSVELKKTNMTKMISALGYMPSKI